MIPLIVQCQAPTLYSYYIGKIVRVFSRHPLFEKLKHTKTPLLLCYNPGHFILTGEYISTEIHHEYIKLFFNRGEFIHGVKPEVYVRNMKIKKLLKELT